MHGPEVERDRVAGLLANARRPLILIGRLSKRQEDWDRRLRLAELLGAPVAEARGKAANKDNFK